MKAVVITGASSGIGRACALHLDQLGFQVFAGVRREIDGNALAQQASRRFKAILFDVTSREAIAGAVAYVSAQVGDRGLAGLVNNAGIAVAAPLEFIPLGELRRQLEVNVVGQMAVTQAFLPLIRQGKGRIVNMSSISGLVATPFLGPYAASKFALEALSDALRRELSPWGIHVALVEPGRIKTPIWEKSLRAADQIAAQLPPGAIRKYGVAMDENRRRAGKKTKGAPVEAVARAVVHALTAERPKIRYLVGVDARLGALLARWLPARILDWLIVRQRGLQ